MEQMGAGALHSYSRGRARRRSPRCAKLCPPPRARAAPFPPCGAPGPGPIRKARTLHRSRAFPPPRRRAHRACAAPSSCDVARARARALPARCTRGGGEVKKQRTDRSPCSACHTPARPSHHPDIVDNMPCFKKKKKRPKKKEPARKAVPLQLLTMLMRCSCFGRKIFGGGLSADSARHRPEALAGALAPPGAARISPVPPVFFPVLALGAGGEEPASHQSARTGRGAPPGSAAEPCCDARCRAPRARQRRRCARRRRQASPLLLANRTRRSASCTAGAERCRRTRWKKGGKEESL